MTRNVKRFLAASLSALAPAIALAGPVEFGNRDFSFQHHGYVSAREGALQVPSRKGSSELLPSAVQNYYNFNLNLSSVYRVYLGPDFPFPLTPDPVPYNNWGGFQLNPGIPATTQTYYWTANPLNPGAGPTCVWQLVYSINNGVCEALINQATYGGAICIFDFAQSFIDNSTCDAQIVTYFQ